MGSAVFQRFASRRECQGAGSGVPAPQAWVRRDDEESQGYFGDTSEAPH
jgi:hypothetical protein